MIPEAERRAHVKKRLRTAYSESERRAHRVLKVLVVAVGCSAILAASVVVIGGWAGGVAALRSIVPGFSTMKVNTAIAIGALGIALALMGADKRHRPIVDASASIALIIGAVTLAEYAFQWNAGIDQLWFKDIESSPLTAPGRPAVATAVMITLLGVAVLCAGWPVLASVKTASATLASMIAWVTLNGYVFGPEAVHEVALFSSVAVHTAVLVLLLGFGVLAADPISWPVRTALTPGTGGVICRWLLPPAILAPPALGWLLSREGRLDFFPRQFDWALYSAISTLGSVWLIMTLAHRIAVIDAERSSATELSRQDPMTGLANRRAFDAFLLESFKLSRRHGHALSLLLFDIDYFKAYNDTFGHPAGDELLKGVGDLLTSLARQTDLVARLGGDEFGIVLPETDAAGARVLAERVRTELEQSTGFNEPVTVSVGVSVISEAMRATSDLVQDCDSALYRAKSSGRNRVFSNTPDHAQSVVPLRSRAQFVQSSPKRR